jgi:hypothetical protein
MLVNRLETLDPLSEYLRRVERWRAAYNLAQQAFIRIGNIRLVVAIVAAALGWFAYRGAVSGWLLLIPLAVFIALVVYHEQVARRQQFAERAIGYYERGLARLDDKWAGTGNTGDRFMDGAHVYSGDLDIFGKGSLFELLCVARTAEGEQRLASWLLDHAPPDEVASRQAAIADLRGRIQLREDLALLGDDIRAGVHASVLAKWAAASPVAFPAGARWIALALALTNIAIFSAFMIQLAPGRAVILAIAASLLFGYFVRRQVGAVSEAADTPAHDLQILALLLHRLESEQFRSPRLAALRAKLDIQGLPASARILRLRRWMELLDSADHLFVRVIGPPLLWRQQVAMGVEAWRRRTGPHVAAWIDAVAELEALSSLAALSFERPNWVAPELVEGEPLFDARSLQHPLMSPARCVPNDIAVGRGVTLVIVSGSNMSGKSTMLRAVGLNAVLAWAGGPVAARELKISRVAVGASIRIVDSLQDGKSRFYAEITRLRQIVDLTSRERPVLFLLDELLSGTNSHDRRIGAEAVVRSLAERGGIGFVTTHDLALTAIAPEMNGRAANVHFEDHLVDGAISFDYKMRPGVVERSNALELMRAVGLDV